MMGLHDIEPEPEQAHEPTGCFCGLCQPSLESEEEETVEDQELDASQSERFN